MKNVGRRIGDALADARQSAYYGIARPASLPLLGTDKGERSELRQRNL
jgi:hypothetical protein